MQLLIHHKWFIRAGLATFWTAEIIAFAFNRGFITYMLEKHTWWSLIILFLTFKYLIEPFYAPFLKLKKEGGEAIMEKSTKILLVFAAALGALVVAMAIEESRAVVINAFKQGFLNPIYAVGRGFNTWLGTYPGLWILGSGVLGGLALAVIVNQVALPKIRAKKAPTKPHMGGPEYVPGTVLPQQSASTQSNPIEKPVEPTVETATEKETSE